MVAANASRSILSASARGLRVANAPCLWGNLRPARTSCFQKLAADFIRRSLPEVLRLHRRPFVSAGKADQRQRKFDPFVGKIDRLDGQQLTLLELSDQFGSGLVLSHAGPQKARRKRCAQGRMLIDND